MIAFTTYPSFTGATPAGAALAADPTTTRLSCTLVKIPAVSRLAIGCVARRLAVLIY